MAVVNFVPLVPVSLSIEIDALLQEFEDVFAKPSTLPPRQICDHSIPLLPNAVPMNSRP